MKRISLIIFACIASVSLFGQDITGQWNGLLTVQGMKLRLVFHITKTDAGYSSTMDSPDQGAKGIPVSSTTFENPNLTLRIPAGTIEYTAILKDGVFIGKFRQAGLTADLDLKREAIDKPVTRRPQDPIKPYPYRSEEVTIENSVADVKLAGTLTLPAEPGRYPVAVLVSGSGPQNRDEELLGHKPFLILSDYLTRNGIAVLRYDDRGTGASTGNFSKATSADFATDAEAAVAWLKTRPEIDSKHIGIIGHSEGGLIGPMVAARSKDVAFVVMLAGPGMKGLDLLPLQSDLIARASGTSEADLASSKEINSRIFSIVAEASDEAELQDDLKTYLTGVIGKFPKDQKPENMKDEEFIQTMVNQIANPWMRYFLNYDPIPGLKKLKCPVFALIGEKDLQVPAKENLPLIEKALKKNHRARVVEMPGMNHLFQVCTTGSPSEYAEIEETMSPKALGEVAQWILANIK